MLRIIALLLTVLSGAWASVSPYQIDMTSVDSTGTTLVSTFLGPLSGGYFVGYDPVNKIPAAITVGTGLTLTGNVLSASGGMSRSFSAVTRTIGTSFQVSSIRDSFVTYGVNIGITTLLTTVSGTVTLKYADDSGITTNVVTVMTGTSSLGLLSGLASTNTVTLTGMIPAGKYAIIVSTSTGSPTYSSPAGLEVLQ